jgi:hypothetical protein
LNVRLVSGTEPNLIRSKSRTVIQSVLLKSPVNEDHDIKTMLYKIQSEI